MTSLRPRSVFLFFALLGMVFGSVGCSILGVENVEEVPTTTAPTQYQQAIPFAETIFNLTVPVEVQENVILEVIDDTTGIELNPTRYAMEKTGSTTYKLTLPTKLGSVVKYRFLRDASLPIYEATKSGDRVQYRTAYVNTAVEFYDLITNWEDQQYEFNYGRIEGTVTNRDTNAPLPNLLVSAGGLITFTNSMGGFSLNGLPPGKHNLVVLSTDGEYNVFQQEALVGEGLTTPATIKVTSSNFVNITFIAHPPSDHDSSAPIRILGNTYQLGNVFAEVYNGVNNIASRAPKLTALPDGRYTITLSLPVGMDLRYKYSLGDGFWNAEQSADQLFRVRQIIVPEQDTVIEDSIYSWKAGNSAPVKFNVVVPENTDPNDIVSIQFNAFGWNAPIPMEQVSLNKWTYTLNGPFNLLSHINYRYCRNDACGVADDMNSLGSTAQGYSFTSSPIPQSFEDQVQNWFGWNPDDIPTTLVAPTIINRGNEFRTGVYFANRYNVLEAIYIDRAYQNLTEINNNTVIIPIEWTLNAFSTVDISPIPGTNPLWKDNISIIHQAQKNGLSVWLAPNIELSDQAMQEWNLQDMPTAWEADFANEYSEFLIYTADLAGYMGVTGIILPTNTIKLSSSLDEDALTTVIIEENGNQFEQLKQRFNGPIYLETNNSSQLNAVAAEKADGFLVKSNIQLIDSSLMIEEFQQAFNLNFETEIFPYYEKFAKPIWVGLDFPSAKGAESGCVQFGDECIDFQVMHYLNSDTQSTVPIDLQLQADIYQAALAAINQTPWIQGVISYGYNPQVALQGCTSSVRGKPASDVLWYWNPRMLGYTE